MKIRFGLTIVLLAVLAIGCKKDTTPPVYITFTDARDGHTYQGVEIGSQTWMAENLAYLPAVSPTSEASSTEAHYYVFGYEGSGTEGAKMEANYNKYGVLYNYTAAQTACPDGWHLPTGKEWDKLKNGLGFNAGNKLKSTSEWHDGGNGDNSSGFNAWPSGEQYTLNWGFTDLGWFAFFWTSTEGEYRLLSWNNGRVDFWSRFVDGSESPKSFGFSVRCVKN